MLRKINYFISLALALMMSGCIISGTVTNESEEGVIDVSISFGAGGSAITDEDGNYWSPDILPMQYAVIPSKEGYTFTPPSRTVTIIDFLLNQTTGINFTATRLCPELVWVGDYNTTDHEDSLEDLSGYTSVNGNLNIEETPLAYLEELECLTQVGGSLIIRINNSLTTLSGLDNMTSIGGYLLIRENNSLATLAGLDNITSVGGDLIIHYNNSIANLELDNLNRVDGYFTITSNISLHTSLADDLRSQVESGDGIGGSITICGNLEGDPCP